ncbi:Uncharacterised protein [Vibrio cholerae]|nr:Uncharacterised protein [Vibrio cholerae]
MNSITQVGNGTDKMFSHQTNTVSQVKIVCIPIYLFADMVLCFEFHQ